MLTFNHRITFFVLAVIISVDVFAQNQITLWGNVENIPDVNIQIQETNYGTSTNAFGEYSLSIYSMNNSVDIHFSCIGYQDTILTLDLHKAVADSINLNVNLREISYQLNDFVVTASQYFVHLPGERIIDVEFLNSGVLLLALNNKETIVYIFDYSGFLMQKQILTKKYSEIHRDCFNNLILVSKDFCLQILYDEVDSCIYAIDRFTTSEFYNKLKPCLLEYHNHLLFDGLIESNDDFKIDRHHHKKKEYYFAENTSSQNDPIHLISFFDERAYRVAQSKYGEILARYSLTTPDVINIFEAGMWDGNILRLINDDLKLFNMISWYQNIESRPIKIDVFIEKDTLVFLDRVTYQLIKYNQKWQKTKTNTIIENKNTFDDIKDIIQDKKTEGVYGIMENRGMYSVVKIDTHKGSISTPLYTSSISFPDIMEVFDNHAYIVFFDSYTRSSKIIRKKLY